MADTTGTEEYVQVKLLVDEESNKVVFAEAEKDFVDILCSFLTLPLGTIARLIQKDSNIGPVTVGCLNSLYQSAADLEASYLWEKTDKEMLLQPKNSSEDYCSILKINIDDTPPTKYFQCSDQKRFFVANSCLYLSKSKYAKCACGNRFDSPVSLTRFCKGFVKNVAPFVITDDLIIVPNSKHYSIFSLLKNMGIVTVSTKDVIVNVTKEKVLDILKCALVSKSPLTDVFLGKKPFIDGPWYFSSPCDENSNIQITIQVVIRKSNGKILLAHGEEDFADLLLSFLTFPLGGVVRKLGGYSSEASIDGLYNSIAKLDEHLMSEEAKNRLVDPKLASEFKSRKNVLPIKEPQLHFYCYYQGEKYVRKIFDSKFFISDERKEDIGKYEVMQLLKDNENRSSKEGYVKGPRTYLVTDDLVVGPSSPISAQLLINHLNIPLHDLVEKIVTIGMKECLSILKAALTSTSALTNGLSHLLMEVKEQK